jgi:capsid protein
MSGINPFGLNIMPSERQTSLGYDIVDQTDRRKQPSPNIRSEDVELNPAMRQQLVAQANDCMRNFAIARWAVGKHLDFVSRHSFSCQTKTSFDTDVQDLMTEWMNEPELCDSTGRHTFDRIVRMTEARAVIVGDHLLSMLKPGQIQQIETDRLRDEVGVSIDGTKVQGIWMDSQGKAISYRVWERMPYGGYQNPVNLPRAGVCFHAYWPNERSDQVRGIGLITAGLSDFCDAYEWQSLTKAVAKLRTAFGVVFTSEALDGIGVTNQVSSSDEESDDEEGDSAPVAPKYEVDFGRGPLKIELEPGEDMKFVNDDSPSPNTFEFFKSTIGFALKSLDIPLCFYDEGLTNFFGQRAALILYLESCKTKRKNLVMNVLRPITRWKIVQWIAQGRLKLPANGNIAKIPFNWHPAGTPYWNPTQEINADIQAIQSGLGNWEDIYLERTGRDWFHDMLRLKEQQKFLIDNEIALDPKVIQIIQIATDPEQFGIANPLSKLPTSGGLAL